MAELNVDAYELGGFQTNCYIVSNLETREAIVIDPSWNAKMIKKKLDDKNLKCVGIYLTHGHIDHMAAMDELKSLLGESTGAQTYASEDERDVLGNSRVNLSAMMTSVFEKVVETSVDNYLADGDVRKLLDTEMRCISVPGHTRGGMCYYFEQGHILFSGDTLFKYSVGRSDFPTGDENALLENIREKLFVLPDDTVVYPGHGDKTQIGKEKKMNPFF